MIRGIDEKGCIYNINYIFGFILGVREMFIVKRDVFDRWEGIPDSLKKMKFDIIIVEE